MKTEIGVVRCHPVVFMWRQVKSIYRTWRFAKEQGFPHNEWYGVYLAGTEHVLAQVGCLPDAKDRAKKIAVALQD